MNIPVPSIVAAGLALACVFPAWGQALSDPTRPPQEWLDAQPKVAGAPSAFEQEAPPHLQSLLIGPSYKYAIIDGQLVGVGDTFNDSRVVKVSPTEVVLRSERGIQTLKLFADVDKRPANPVAIDAAPPPARGKRPQSGSSKSVSKETK
ncbi:MAG: hypothetical protein HYX46_05265 [Betaproteobacteria bacterium]|nr:hypothetical protein [Betaproteobacteria bacterium]